MSWGAGNDAADLRLREAAAPALQQTPHSQLGDVVHVDKPGGHAPPGRERRPWPRVLAVLPPLEYSCLTTHLVIAI
jgi:hypothetical protein